MYDVIGVLGWNDAPVQRGRGSAIFLHVARPDYAPTEGCIALALADLRQVLAAGLDELYCADLTGFAAQPAHLQRRQIGRPAPLLLAPQLVQVVPRVDAGVVQVVEDSAAPRNCRPARCR